ncbi:glycoside hydrolase family 15 protein [Variovorax sp. J22R115]|uniref:glycoside hydrolase family 15 protein n=1 Tax=Variovorax sp. J22R115 TaxID=3053509 RepID=UPI0025768E08|nr:glycoside hydrolase family 15 protein [Variovorax sp. J22R115]MDM0047650.1 glycoside hydrolase family 15 protein [Variovorax sp. J22R115]
MALRIEDYGLIGDMHTAALVGIDGSIDWLCLPRFDSSACFANLLGTEENGRWRIAPTGNAVATTRRYRPSTLVLETEFETADGVVRLIDCMALRASNPRIVRIVEGVRGTVPMSVRLNPRFDYGKTAPWILAKDQAVSAGAGPEAVELRADVPITSQDRCLEADFSVNAGERVCFVLTGYLSWEDAPPPIDALDAVAETEAWWRAWSGRSTYKGAWKDEVERSLITLKALTYAPTGGLVAAPTTSLPEFLGGVRNWDYRYCWIRDAALALDALMSAGYVEEATQWRDWVIRAVAGDPEDLQIMYGIAGERRLDEYELGWLAGYEGSAPVRVGNAASGQLQLDVYGELADAIYRARRLGMTAVAAALDPTQSFVLWLERHWREPDDGIWEVRGPRRQFVHSKVMAWVAADRVVKMLQGSGYKGAMDELLRMRDDIHEEVCRNGFDAERNTFTQYYGSTQLDAALLLIPQVGFLPATDPRVAGTVEAIQRELVHDGFVMRYIPDKDAADGLPPGEGAFLACSFWLVNDLAMLGRLEEAQALFDRLLSLRNDLGLFAEEYDQAHQRLIGNFPQAFTHLTFIASAMALSEAADARGSTARDR